MNWKSIFKPSAEDEIIQRELAQTKLLNHKLKKVLTLVAHQTDFPSTLSDRINLWICLLDKKRALSPSDFRINTLFDALNAKYNAALQSKSLQLRHEIMDNPKVSSDYNLLLALTEELLNNAIKYSEEGNEIIFRSFEDMDDLCIEIEDLGIGMTPEQMMHVFDYDFNNFSRGTNKEFGLGIGIQIVDQGIRLLKGQIELESNDAEGCCVRLIIPIGNGN